MRVEVKDNTKKKGEMIVKSINLTRYAIPFNTPFECDPILYKYLSEEVPFRVPVENDNGIEIETQYRPRCNISIVQE